MAISYEYCREVFDDGRKATQDPKHPCRPMVQWQADNNYAPFQLPEPFSGREAALKIAFVGMNPSASLGELIPTASPAWTFDAYDKFYRSRFDDSHRDQDGKLCVTSIDGKPSRVRLWNNIELFGKYLSDISDGHFALGVHAILIEAIRYKSKKGWHGRTKGEREGVLKHQLEFTKKIIDDGGFSIVVPMGNMALHNLVHVLEFRKKPPIHIMDAMGEAFVGFSPNGAKVTVCPIKHLSRPPSVDAQKSVARRIIQAYRQLRA